MAFFKLCFPFWSKQHGNNFLEARYIPSLFARARKPAIRSMPHPIHFNDLSPGNGKPYYEADGSPCNFENLPWSPLLQRGKFSYWYCYITDWVEIFLIFIHYWQSTDISTGKEATSIPAPNTHIENARIEYGFSLTLSFTFNLVCNCDSYEYLLTFSLHVKIHCKFLANWSSSTYKFSRGSCNSRGFILI
jgi:hypothetical protein